MNSTYFPAVLTIVDALEEAIHGDTSLKRRALERLLVLLTLRRVCLGDYADEAAKTP